jgi:hypothetical protein
LFLVILSEGGALRAAEFEVLSVVEGFAPRLSALTRVSTTHPSSLVIPTDERSEERRDLLSSH